MKRELRSNKVNNFMRRAHWLTLGLNNKDIGEAEDRNHQLFV